MAEGKRKVRFDWGKVTPSQTEVQDTIDALGRGYTVEPTIKLSIKVAEISKDLLDHIISLADEQEIPVQVALVATYTESQQLSFWDQEAIQWAIPDIPSDGSG